MLNSPILNLSRTRIAKKHTSAPKAARIDITFDITAGSDALQNALDAIEREAEEAVRGGAEHLMLDDHNVNETRMAIPSVLAVGAVHAHLVMRQLRTFTSLNIASGECLDVHHFAVLIGIGATTINPWLAEESVSRPS